MNNTITNPWLTHHRPDFPKMQICGVAERSQAVKQSTDARFLARVILFPGTEKSVKKLARTRFCWKVDLAVACPHCGIDKFSPGGLRAHHCKSLNRQRVSPEAVAEAIDTALERKLQEILAL